MPYPNSNTLNIVIPQTSASLQGGQAPFVETIISGSRLILQTDSFGFLTGSSDINVNSITASNISASGYISSSNLYVKNNITDAGTLTVVGASTLAGLTGTTATFSGLVSASAGLTASAIQDAGTLTVVGNSILSTVFATNITASNISASGNISASTLRVENSIVDGGTLTVIGNTVLGDAVTDSTQITGSTLISGSLSVVGNSTLQNTFVTNLTASNISASGNVSSSNLWVQNSIVDNGTLTVIGNSTLSNVFATNVTASNISASGFITASSIYDTGTLTVLGNSTLSNVFATNITASNLSASNKIVASEITASNELFVGTGPAYRTYGEAAVNENLARLYVSGSATIFSKYATLNLATSASDAGAQSSILFSRLASSGSETVFQPRMQLGTESGSNDLRVYAYYVSTDPDNNAQASGSNIVPGTRAIFKQSGYFGVGNFISYGANGGASKTYVSSLPGYDGIVGPDAMLTILPMDSASFGSAGSKQYNRNILNIMSYDTSSIMFISGSDGYVLLGKNTTDGINRLQIAGNVSASAYTGSSANFTNLIATNITSSNISASGNISASTVRVETSIVDGGTLTVLGNTVLGDAVTDTTRITGSTSISGSLSVVGNTTLANTFVTNLTASNISASGFISGSDGIFSGDIAVNGGDITTTTTGTATLFNTNAQSVTIGGAATGQVLLGNAAGTVKSAGDFIAGTNIIKDGSGGVAVTVTSALTTIAGDLQVNGNDIKDSGGNTNLTLGINEVTVPVDLYISRTDNATSYTDTTAALRVDGGARISKDTWISGSLNVAGDFTVFGSSSVVYISSSTVIINDNIIQLNAFFPYERYAGFEVFDSGSNQRSASLLWDGLNDNWTTVDQNNSASNIIIGPTASFGNAIPNLTVNRLTKAYEGNGITDSLISDDGTTLRYTGNVISASSITASYGTVTYITGALVTYVTGSFTTLTIVTGSNPGAGAVPSTPTSAGMPGQINVDNNFIYVYTNNIWKRVPISNWSV